MAEYVWSGECYDVPKKLQKLVEFQRQMQWHDEFWSAYAPWLAANLVWHRRLMRRFHDDYFLSFS